MIQSLMSQGKGAICLAEQNTGAVFVGGRYCKMCAEPSQTNTSPLQRPVWKPPGEDGRTGGAAALPRAMGSLGRAESTCRTRGSDKGFHVKCFCLDNVQISQRAMGPAVRGPQLPPRLASAVQSTYLVQAAAVKVESPVLLLRGTKRESALLFILHFERSPEASGGQSLVACVLITSSLLQPQNSLSCYTRRSMQQMQQLSDVL